MKSIIIVLTCCISLSAAAQHIEFPLDMGAVTIDGVLQQPEWQNAKKATIGVNATDSVQVLYKHDNSAMYFAFTGKLESATALFPEVLTDGEHKGGANWVSGQWWFHVSATDCENNGGYGVYTNCQATQPDWIGGPNFTSGAPMTDTVEIKIPFAKTGFNPATMDTMGIAFMVTNTATIFKLYPSAADRNQPATWANATFSKIPAGIATLSEKGRVTIYPNPAKEVVQVSGFEKGSVLQVKDMTGRTLYSKIANHTGDIIFLQGFAPGIYIIEVEGKTGARQYSKFCVN